MKNFNYYYYYFYIIEYSQHIYINSYIRIRDTVVLMGIDPWLGLTLYAL